jgi:hypothetical protein
MSRIFAIHEYELTHDTDNQEFEQVLKNILMSKELDMPGLESRHLLKGYKGERKSKIAIIVFLIKILAPIIVGIIILAIIIGAGYWIYGKMKGMS